VETNFEQMKYARSLIARERVCGDVKMLARDAQGLLKATAGDVSNKSKEFRARVTRTLERAWATCGELRNQTAVTAKAALKKTDDTLRAHPYESIGLAFGAGLLFGIQSKRRGS
jgi:ElaB/YqjD/DUF883 family membrane-anchored ribosome-binding protein